MATGECSKTNNGNILAINSANSIGSVLCKIISDDSSVYLSNRHSMVESDYARKGRCINLDGPKPMRNFKPVQKRRTGAEGFEILHQSVYETRASEHGIPRVDKTYPHMHEELSRKRSTAKVIMAKKRRMYAECFSPYQCQETENGPSFEEKTNPQPRGDLNKKRSMAKATNKQNKKIKRRTTSRFRKRRRNIKPQSPRGVVKRRPRSKCVTNCKFSNKSCQFKYFAINNSEKNVSTNDHSDNEVAELGPNNNNFTKTYERYYERPKSELRRSIASLSTFNSYLSMEHEPMI